MENDRHQDMSAAITIFIYKRPENLEAIISVLREFHPAKIFLIADGPKNKSEALVVKKTREKIESLIDWPCQVYKNYSEVNMGLKGRFKTGIDWVFSHCNKAIFIEDDCIPNYTFFEFCDELLEKYKDDKRIMTISGNNFEFGKHQSKESYHFSLYPHVWGWATWKRAWADYDSDISDWPLLRNTPWLRTVLGGFVISKFWKYIFDRLYKGEINTWDYQLAYASWKTGSLHIVPSINLVSNVGYGRESTNIKHKNKTLYVPARPIHFPLIHPKQIIANKAADRLIDNLVYVHPLGKVSLLIKSLLGIL
ncbi:glycosyltransferase family 2 protein [Candidatus Woesebacteria bacterium]|nr:glycosyltransferase family 2 protein [Candidatus Woesebacteria bacterium]